jgi:hypothetical protein
MNSVEGSGATNKVLHPEYLEAQGLLTRVDGVSLVNGADSGLTLARASALL